MHVGLLSGVNLTRLYSKLETQVASKAIFFCHVIGENWSCTEHDFFRKKYEIECLPLRDIPIPTWKLTYPHCFFILYFCIIVMQSTEEHTRRRRSKYHRTYPTLAELQIHTAFLQYEGP